MKIVICDIDNCISDDGHRIHLIDKTRPPGWQRYHLYHKACIHDKADFIPEMGKPNYEIHYISGMSEAYRPFRLQWFLKHGKKPGLQNLHLRQKIDEGMSAVEMKRRVILQLLEKEFNPEDVIACYDDRREIVQMYNDLGLPGVHRAIRDDEGLYNATGP